MKYFDWPWKINHGMGSYVLVGLLTFIPGILLMILSLNTFKYFRFLNQYCEFSVEQELKRTRND